MEKGKLDPAAMEKNFAQIEQNKQQRSHVHHTAVPADTEGVNGEIRTLQNGTAYSIIVKVGGKWRQSSLI